MRGTQLCEPLMGCDTVTVEGRLGVKWINCTCNTTLYDLVDGRCKGKHFQLFQINAGIGKSVCSAGACDRFSTCMEAGPSLRTCTCRTGYTGSKTLLVTQKFPGCSRKDIFFFQV